MAWVRQKLIFAVALVAALGMSQFPEFAQQYRQRLGGALEELARVVNDFDRDATSAGLSRSEALELHLQSTVPLFQARGRSMSATINRYETLLQQQADFAARSTLTQPLVLVYSDEATITGVWHDFSPAVPTTSDGLSWAALGFLLGAGLAQLVAAFLNWGWRRNAQTVRRSA